MSLGSASAVGSWLCLSCFIHLQSSIFYLLSFSFPASRSLHPTSIFDTVLRPSTSLLLSSLPLPLHHGAKSLCHLQSGPLLHFIRHVIHHTLDRNPASRSNPSAAPPALPAPYPLSVPSPPPRVPAIADREKEHWQGVQRVGVG